MAASPSQRAAAAWRRLSREAPAALAPVLRAAVGRAARGLRALADAIEPTAPPETSAPVCSCRWTVWFPDGEAARRGRARMTSFVGGCALHARPDLVPLR